MIGHNQPSFDDIVKQNLECGMLLAIKETIIAAIHDPRLERRHLRVLALVVDRLNGATGMSYPGRKKLSEDSAGLGWTTYTEMTVATTIKELIRWGYLVSERRGPEGGGRALSHYTVAKPAVEDLQAQIQAWVRMQTRDPARFDAFKKPKPDVENGVPVRNSNGENVVPIRTRNGENGLPINHEDPVLPIKSNGDPVLPADGDPVLPTVTSIGTSNINTHDLFGSEQPDQADQDAAASVKTTPDFEAFWKVYPRRDKKVSAFDAFTKIVGGKHKKIEATPARIIIAGAKAFAEYVAREGLERQFVALPASWLNEARWADEATQPKPQATIPWWQKPDVVAKATPQKWAEGIAKFCADFWDVTRLGPPPGDAACVVPRAVIDDLRLTEMFDSRGLRRS